MRRITALLFALVFVLSLTACKGKNQEGQTTPGNLSTATPKPSFPHISTETVDVSGEFTGKLCRYPWLDTYDMNYYRFFEDGTYQHLGNKEMTDVLDTGTWKMLKDAEGYLTLHVEVEGGESFDMYEIELYDENIFAHSLTETDYIWVLYDSAE
jgi:hypothetical protein